MTAIWIRGFICGFALATALGFAAWRLLRVPAPVVNLAEAPQATAPHRVIQRLQEIRPIEGKTNEEKRLKLIFSGVDHGMEIDRLEPVVFSGVNWGMEIDRLEHIERIRHQLRGPIVEPDQGIWKRPYSPHKRFRKPD